MRVDAAIGGTSTDNEVVDMEGGGATSRGAAILDTHGVFLRLTQRRAGQEGRMETARRSILVLRPAALDIRCQSLGTKERAMETGPSCWTKG